MAQETMPLSDGQLISSAEVEESRDVILGATIIVLDSESRNYRSPIGGGVIIDALAICKELGVGIVGIEVQALADSALEGHLRGVIETIPFAVCHAVRLEVRHGSVRRAIPTRSAIITRGQDGGRAVDIGLNSEIMRLVADVSEADRVIRR